MLKPWRSALRYLLAHVGRNSLVSLGVVDEFIEAYPLGNFSLKGKTVIDIGCDEGTTPILWRALGAARVIGYESNPKLVSRMDALRREPWFDFRGPWKGELPHGELLKLDCDGCESMLNVEHLSEFAVWFVALHHHPATNPRASTFSLRPAIEALGGRIVYAYRDGSEITLRGGDYFTTTERIPNKEVP